MANVINTNISSLNAQRNLSTSQSSLATSLQRLSTGLRINSAKDDAAGQAISTRMTAQISGMQQASRNANDGISMSQTAEGAMSSVNDILLRMRDLSVQASNGTNGTAERATIQGEVDQLYEEIDRISGSTDFNGIKLLDGSAKNNSFQVGANAGQTISFGIKEVSTKAMSLGSASALGDLNSGRVGDLTGIAADGFTINGSEVDLSSATDLAGVRDAINQNTGTTGVTASAYNTVKGTAGANGVTSGLTIGVGSNTFNIDDSTGMSDLVDKINKQAGGVTASIGSNGGLLLSNDTGAAITVGGTTNGSGLDAITNGGVNNGYLSLKSTTGDAIKVGGKDGAVDELNKLGFNASTGSTMKSAGMIAGGAAASTAADAIGLLDDAQGKLESSDNVSINGVKLGTSGASAADKAAAINAVKGQTGVTATASTSAYVDVDFAAVGNLLINGTEVDLSTAPKDMAELVTAINSAGISGVTASADAETGKLMLTSASGNDITIGNDGAVFATGVSDNAKGTPAPVAADGTVAVRGKVELASENGASVRVTGNDTSIGKLGLVAQGGNAETIGGKLSVTTQANAQAAISAIDKAISYVAEQRSNMGAVQNRLSTTISNLATATENASSARSRIQDTDFATETANMTRGQILQQAGTAMLAQANSLPNGVLSLLRG